MSQQREDFLRAELVEELRRVENLVRQEPSVEKKIYYFSAAYGITGRTFRYSFSKEALMADLLLIGAYNMMSERVTTPMNKFTGIYGLSPMVCDPIPISLRCFSLSLESFQLLATNLTSDTMRFEVK